MYPEGVSNSQTLLSFTNIHRPTSLQATILGLHGFAKGVAVGLADSCWDCWFLVVAAVFHEVVSGVELSLRFVPNKELTWMVISFAIMGSVAIAVGKEEYN